ncbi:6-phosphogluconolactonase [Flavobacterium segetis]|uniref:6-phosphogluconolactonase n=1 Tax=Flavobacterium segetis TaxID=271157 RepID=A0A1M5HJK3_9FLAO|nr:lactonase family protein [Flavobacterium segetis]SHG16081.1 6-phosphogluconolactonase [Flavobacterium segetis]
MKNSLFLFLFLCAFVNSHAQHNKLNLLIGTYTTKCDSKGIYVYDFDSKTGDFNYKNATENVINPSYLTISKDKNFVYAVNENGANSTVSSFKFESNTGKLHFLNKENSKGEDPCYIIDDNKNVIVANYSSGTIAVFGKESNGSISKAKQVIQHYAIGHNSYRQEKPHAHMVYFSPDNKYVLANDLGIDKVFSYAYNPDSSDEILKIKDSISVKSGNGPRHLIFSKNGKFIYLLNELAGSITVFSYFNGILKQKGENSLISKDFIGTIGAADIHISPDGKFLYATNRGTANNISTFKIFKNGRLKFVAQNSTLGKGPRNFVIDPTGNFLLVAHQYTNDVVIFRRNKKNGKLTDTKKKINLCSPVCLVFSEK